MSGAAGNELDTVPVQWRADMLKLMLRVCVTLGALVYIPKLPYVWRASAFCSRDWNPNVSRKRTHPDARAL